MHRVFKSFTFKRWLTIIGIEYKTKLWLLRHGSREWLGHVFCLGHYTEYWKRQNALGLISPQSEVLRRLSLGVSGSCSDAVLECIDGRSVSNVSDKGEGRNEESALANCNICITDSYKELLTDRSKQEEQHYCEQHKSMASTCGLVTPGLNHDNKS